MQRYLGSGHAPQPLPLDSMDPRDGMNSIVVFETTILHGFHNHFQYGVTEVQFLNNIIIYTIVFYPISFNENYVDPKL